MEMWDKVWRIGEMRKFVGLNNVFMDLFQMNSLSIYY